MTRAAAGKPITWSLAPCDLGHLVVATTERGLCSVGLGDDPADLEARLSTRFPTALLTRDDHALVAVVDAVRQRIAGDPAPAAVPLDISGTAFQCRVWTALARIPYGEVRTYGEVARDVDAPKAVRAVGTACGANPVGLVIPCHRVVPGRGGVGNYGFGAARKAALLRREGASVAELVGDADHPAAARDHD